jgi:hypothetical protein
MCMFGSGDSGSHRDAQVDYTRTARVCEMACLEERWRCDVELSLSAACIKEWSKKHGVRVLTEEYNDGSQTADTITHEYH